MASKRDAKYRAYRGSECQIQLCVNSPKRRATLDAKALDALPTLRHAGAKELCWRSPLLKPLFPTDHPFHEYRDGKLLDAIDRSDLRPEWRDYWPTGSQKWDAVAVAVDAAREPLGPVLVEAKSYPGEFRASSGGTRAKGGRRARIEHRLWQTRESLGAQQTPEVKARWLGELYQSANRFSTLCFFRCFLEPSVDAWLLNVYFLNDQTHASRKHATSRGVWKKALRRAETDLGCADVEVAHSSRVFLDAGTYDELVAATGD